MFKVWGFTVAHDETRLITGCSDSELRVWKISSGSESEAEESGESNKKHSSKRSAEAAGLDEESEEKSAEVMYGLLRKHKQRCTLFIRNAG